MVHVNLNVLVKADIINVNNGVKLSAYRLFMNSELMSERTWIWRENSNSINIKEDVWANLDLDVNKTHTLCLEQIFILSYPNITLGISRLNVLTHQFEILNSDSNSITFRIV